MKKITFPIQILSSLFILFFFSCKEKVIEETCSDGIKNQNEIEVDCGGVCSKCPIEYPNTSVTGLPNVLHPDFNTLDKDLDYSLTAVLPEETSLWIKMTRTSATGAWYLSDEYNMSFSDFTGSQTFTVIEPGTATVTLSFADEGEATIEIHENGAGVAYPTATKTITWE